MQVKKNTTLMVVLFVLVLSGCHSKEKAEEVDSSVFGFEGTSDMPITSSPISGGSLKIHATVEGEGSGAFSFHVSCEGVELGERAAFDLAAGGEKVIDSIPAGTRCQVLEDSNGGARSVSITDSTEPQSDGAVVIADRVQSTVTFAHVFPRMVWAVNEMEERRLVEGGESVLERKHSFIYDVQTGMLIGMKSVTESGAETTVTFTETEPRKIRVDGDSLSGDLQLDAMGRVERLMRLIISGSIISAKIELSYLESQTHPELIRQISQWLDENNDGVYEESELASRQEIEYADDLPVTINVTAPPGAVQTLRIEYRNGCISKATKVSGDTSYTCTFREGHLVEVLARSGLQWNSTAYEYDTNGNVSLEKSTASDGLKKDIKYSYVRISENFMNLLFVPDPIKRALTGGFIRNVQLM